MWRLLLGTMGVKSLVQGLNAAATAGFEPRTVWSEVRRRNRLATAPPYHDIIFSAQVKFVLCDQRLHAKVAIFRQKLLQSTRKSTTWRDALAIGCTAIEPCASMLTCVSMLNNVSMLYAPTGWALHVCRDIFFSPFLKTHPYIVLQVDLTIWCIIFLFVERLF